MHRHFCLGFVSRPGLMAGTYAAQPAAGDPLTLA